MRLNRKKAAKLAAFFTLGLAGIVICYFVLLRHPGLFFSHSFTRGGITPGWLLGEGGRASTGP